MIRPRNGVILWVGGLLMAAAAPAWAQEPPAAEPPAPGADYTEDDLFRFLEDEIEVTTASQMKTKLSEVPQAVYVLTREEIERLPALNIADLLRHIPGVMVATASHSQWSVGMDRPVPVFNTLLLVLIDGRSIHSPFTTFNHYWTIPYTIADVERIEVVLGPSSTVHGSQAIYGVVNIITKDAAREGAAGRAAIGGSQGADLEARFGDVFTSTSGTIHIGPARLRAGAGYERLTPWDDPPVYQDGRSIEQIAGQRGFGNLRLEVDFSDDVELTLITAASGYESPWVSFGPGMLEGFNLHNDAELTLDNLITDGDRLSLRAYHRHTQSNLEAEFNPLLPLVFFDIEEHAALGRALYTVPLPANNRLAAAIEARGDFAEVNGLSAEGNAYGYFSVFVQDEFRPVEQLIISGGIRLETQYREGLEFFERLSPLPQVSTVWLPVTGHSIRLAYGQAQTFLGGLSEYYDGMTHQDHLTIYEGNPETARDPMHTWELGYRGQLHSSLVLTLSYTFRVIPERFWIVEGEGAAIPYQYTRFPGTETRHSLDATVSWRPLSQLRTDLAATWNIYADMPEGYRAVRGDVPVLRLSGRIHFSPHERVDVDTDLQFVPPRTARSIINETEQEVSGWFYLNLRLAYRVILDPEIELFCIATNITDTQIGEGVAAEMADPGVSRIGRRFLFGIAAEF